MLPFAANSLWVLSCLRESAAFRRNADRIEETQRELLLRLLRQNAGTEFGKRYGFSSIRSVAEYQSKVPLTTYDDYRDWIERIAEGRQQILTRDPALLLEPTSGSTAATKLIPYTASLKAEFQRAIAAWVADLYLHDPLLLAGKAYWSVTPVTRRDQRTGGGIPIGFEDDAEYLGGWQRALLDAAMAVPASVRWIDEMESFRYVTLLFLLRCRRLALVSVWNPTFFTLLVERLNEWGPRLVEDIARGTIATPAKLDAPLPAQLTAHNKADKRRATELAEIFRESSSSIELHQRLWPNLRCISCWADAQSSRTGGRYAEQLARLFPQARLQGKGLIATEGFVSLPLTDCEGAALAYRSHFFEFIPEDGGHPRLAHELESGARYSVAMTTGGGLYRYQLHDVIECTGFYRACPLLRFVGKADHVSDWFGEKLNAMHVEQAISAAMDRENVSAEFVMLACEAESDVPGYAMFIEASRHSDGQLLSLTGEIERALLTNFHYQYCRELGQLAPLRAFRIARGGMETYLRACQERGQRAGDIKPVALDKRSGWSGRFRGEFLAGQAGAGPKP